MKRLAILAALLLLLFPSTAQARLAQVPNGVAPATFALRLADLPHGYVRDTHAYLDNTPSYVQERFYRAIRKTDVIYVSASIGHGYGPMPTVPPGCQPDPLIAFRAWTPAGLGESACGYFLRDTVSTTPRAEYAVTFQRANLWMIVRVATAPTTSPSPDLVAGYARLMDRRVQHWLATH